MRVDVEINDAAVRAALTSLIQRTGDLTPAMRDISGVLHAAIERAFDTEANPATGEKWPQLSPTTQRRPVAKGTERGAHPILQVTGQLAASMTPDYGPDFAAAGTNLSYAVTHQRGAHQGEFGRTRRGTPIPWGDIPPRPFLGIDAGDQQAILAIISKHLSAASR